MGFYLKGLNPTSEQGKEFYANIFFWPLYIRLMHQTGLFLDREISAMTHNDGFPVTRTRALRLLKEFRKLDSPSFELTLAPESEYDRVGTTEDGGSSQQGKN